MSNIQFSKTSDKSKAEKAKAKLHANVIIGSILDITQVIASNLTGTAT